MIPPPLPIWASFVIGCFGSAALELFAFKNAIVAAGGFRKLPGIYKNWLYWTVRLVLTLAGGGLALVFGCQNSLQALVTGASAEAILAQMSQEALANVGPTKKTGELLKASPTGCTPLS
jgi:hypothetical protein